MDEKKEIVFESDNSLNVPVMVEALFIKYMGKVLDMARISDMSDRNLTQFQRSVKDECYEKIDQAKAILRKYNVSDIDK